MNWLRKLKKNLAAQKQERHDKKTLKTYRLAGLARQCAVCKHFTYRTERPRNWVCRCPGEMRFIGSTCLSFDYGEHPEMIIFSSR